MTTVEPPLAGPLRACARGFYPDEAGIGLLIDHATFLRRDDFREQFIEVDSSTGDPTELATVNWLDAIDALESGGLCCSNGEEKILRLAASLVDGLPVSLRDTLTGIDDRNTQFVIKAMLHATGHQQPHQIP